jgi:hypothetical protein
VELHDLQATPGKLTQEIFQHSVNLHAVCIGVVRVTKSHLPCSRYLLRPSRYSLHRQIELFISQYSHPLAVLHGHPERDFNEENYLSSAHKFSSAPCAKKAGFSKRPQDLHISRVNYIRSPQNSPFFAVLPLPFQSEHLGKNYLNISSSVLCYSCLRGENTISVLQWEELSKLAITSSITTAASTKRPRWLYSSGENCLSSLKYSQHCAVLHQS